MMPPAMVPESRSALERGFRLAGHVTVCRNPEDRQREISTEYVRTYGLQMNKRELRSTENSGEPHAW